MQKLFLLIVISVLSAVSHGASADDSQKSYTDYLQRADKVIEGALGSGRRTIEASAGAFASVYLQDPDVFLWPGMAALAQHKYVTVISESHFISTPVRDAAVYTTRAVFRAGFTPFLVYLTGGIDEINRLADLQDGIDGDLAAAFRELDLARKLISEGRRSQAYRHVMAGNATLLVREHEILQRYFYGTDLGLLGPLLSAFTCINYSDSLRGVHCFASSYPLSCFTDLEKRTAWNVEVLLPAFAADTRAQYPSLFDIRMAGEKAGGTYGNR